MARDSHSAHSPCELSTTQGVPLPYSEYNLGDHTLHLDTLPVASAFKAQPKKPISDLSWETLRAGIHLS